MVVIVRYFAEFVLYRAPTIGKSWLRPCNTALKARDDGITIKRRNQFAAKVFVNSMSVRILRDGLVGDCCAFFLSSSFNKKSK